MLRAILCLACLLPSGAAAAVPVPPLHVQATVQGITVTLDVPTASYRTDAVVRVTVTLKNGGAFPLTTYRGSCPHLTLEAQSVSSDGSALYPPALQPPDPSFTTCPDSVDQIAPGITLTRHLIVVVRGTGLRAVAEASVNGKLVDVVTPTIAVHLTSAPHPKITLATTSAPVATVKRPAGAQGRLTYTEMAVCSAKSKASDTSALQNRWYTTSGSRLKPRIGSGCGTITEWHLLAGWPGSPVGHADYCRDTTHCLYPWLTVRATGKGTQISSETAEMRLTLSLASATYPRNALIRPDVRLVNTSLHGLWITDVCPTGSLSLEVVDDTGGRVYPPSVPRAPAPRCTTPSPTPLPPGHTLERHPFAVLRATHLRALAHASTDGSNTIFETRNLDLQLIPQTGPSVTIHASTAVSATVSPPGSVQGPMYSSYWATCRHTVGGTVKTETLATAPAGWTSAAGTEVTPPSNWGTLSPAFCDVGLTWQAVVGWVDRPVGAIQYVSGH